MVRRLSHLDARGAARMVDVSDKAVTVREAVARGRIVVSREAMRLVRAGRLPKGGVTETARLAGVLAAKRTADAIPLCHPLPLTHVDVDLAPRPDGFDIEARVRTVARTGAEMEALHAVAVAALTVYDMVKAADREMTITDIRLERKSGGRSGPWHRPRHGPGMERALSAAEEVPMPPRGVKRPKRKRQYKKVLSSIRRSGRYKGRQKEVAARIVNKTKREKGETKRSSRKKKSTSRKRSSARARSGAGRG